MNEVLVVNGRGYIEDKETANQFAKTYKSFSKFPRNINDKNIKKVVRRAMRSKQRPIEEAKKDLELEELERTLEESKTGKATGEDDIANEMIKHLGPKGKEMLLCIIISILGCK